MSHYHLKNDYLVTKITCTHGLVSTVEDHIAYLSFNREWKRFDYAKLMSYHNHSRHFLHDLNNPSYEPFELKNVLGTKWWPIR